MPAHESINTVITAYLSKYLEQFLVNLDKARMEYDAEAIHEYRVAVKRIRAIIRALNSLYEAPVFPDDLILPLRLMFKAGGTIRDDQVQIGLVETAENEYQRPFPFIKAFYEKRIDDQRDAFFRKSVDFDDPVVDNIRNRIENEIESLDEHYLGPRLYQWLDLSMEKLKRRRFELERPDRLHRFRTRFKEAGYVVEMLYTSKYDIRIDKKVYIRLKDFGLELGNWHDHYQLWSKTAFIFQESRDFNLLEEAFELRKLITPVHDRLYQELIHLIKRDDALFDLK